MKPIYKDLNIAIMRTPYFDFYNLEKALGNHDYFLELTESDEFKKALLFASPDLYNEVKSLNRQNDTKKRNHIIASVTKYLTRMCTRATPFGGFALCSAVKLDGDSDRISTDARKYHFRYDMAFLNKLAQRLQSCDNTLYNIFLNINPTIYKVGNSWRYFTRNNNIAISEIEQNPVINSVLKYLAHNKNQRFQSLLEYIHLKHHIPDSSCAAYIKRLINVQIIVTDLVPNIIGFNYFERLYDISRQCNNALISGTFRNLNAQLNQLNQAKTADEFELITSKITSDVRVLGVSPKSKEIYQVDLYALENDNTVSKDVIKQISECFNALNPYCTSYQSQNIVNFKNKFRDRYEEQEVRLIEALDPDIGIGYGLESMSLALPPINKLSIPKRHSSQSFSINPLQNIILHKLSQNNLVDEITLTDDDLPQHTSHLDNNLFSFFAMFKIIGIEHNKHILSDLHFVGPSAAKLLTRFADGLPCIANLVNKIADEEQKAYGETILAEISHLNTPRTGNILQRAPLRNYAINYLTYPDNRIATIPINDIYIKIEGNEIKLRAKSINKFISPILTSAHNYNNKTNSVYKFLCELQPQKFVGFSWGNLVNLFSTLPRIKYKDIILSPKKWIFHTKSFYSNGCIQLSLIKSAFVARNLPRYVQYCEGDNTLFIDTNNELSLNAFISAIKNKLEYDITIEEFLYNRDSDQIPSNNEFIVPFIKL
jgi:hypothetical protein